MRAEQRRLQWILGACVGAVLGASSMGGSAAVAEAEAGPSAAGAPAAADAVMARANALMAHRLVNTAYARARDTTSSKRMTAETVILLQEALRLDPANLHTLKLLLEAARSTGNVEVQRDCLKKIIRLDAGDMVSQVAYLDLLASGSQILEERARVYQAALDSARLDPQIRSQMAVRLARLASERGDAEGAKTLLAQALKLNDVNVAALRELARLSERSPDERMKALVALLAVDPYEPAAWIEASNVLASTGVHDRAADFLMIGMEQRNLAGLELSGELYQQLALEYAAAGRTAEAYPILSSLSNLEDAPLSSLMAAALLSAEYAVPARAGVSTTTRPGGGGGGGPLETTPAMRRAQLLQREGDTTHPAPPADAGAAEPGTSAATSAATGPSFAEALAAKVNKRLGASIEAEPKNAGRLAEAVWVELAGMAEVAPDTDKWLKAYAGMVPAGDAALARLRGWQLLREKKYAEAEAALRKLSAADPLAQLGLARALGEQKKNEEAAKQLQDLWSSHPTGLLAFQVAQAARLAHINLKPTVMSQQMLEALRGLPRHAMTAHRDPSDMQLVSASLDKRLYSLNEPVMLTIRLMNTSDTAEPVGVDGVIKTTVGLTAATRGLDARSMGMFAVEDLQRVYRLEPRGTIMATVRADIGALGDFFSLQPTQDLTVGLTTITAPRGSTQSPAAGLGGQTVAVGDFEREGVALKTDVIAKLVQEAGALPLDKKMVRAELLSTLFVAIPKEPATAARSSQEAAEREGLKVLRVSVGNSLQDFVKSSSALMRAWMVQNIPGTGMNEAIQSAMDQMGSDPDQLVRMMWAIRQMAIMRGAAPEVRETLLARVEKQMAAESDATVKEWMGMLLEDEKAMAAQAATKPGR